ncbi:MAG: hypothetical protein HY842_18135 [Bacteroidetes bacterium]|nr:hypothetical protein [Bacteroidota bacterium]
MKKALPTIVGRAFSVKISVLAVVLLSFGQKQLLPAYCVFLRTGSPAYITF